jgi:hypothetical protein
MKTIKTIIAVSICLLSTLSMFGQNKLSISANAGLNLSNTKTFIDTTWNTTQIKGTYFGLNISIPIKSLFLQTGISFNQKGFNYQEVQTDWFAGDTYTLNMSMKTDYLEVPIILGKKFTIKENFGISVFLGGYVASALSGNIVESYEYSGQVEKTSESMKWGQDRDFIRLDYGYNFGSELSYKMISIGLKKSYGICNFTNYDGELYNRTSTMYLTYKF